MSDIFVSYDREDRERVRELASFLETYGWTVWWDTHIPPGKTFAEVIRDAIASAKCMIVVWSTASVSSRWVHKEATEGDRQGKLVPVLFDDVEIPFPFSDVHAAGLQGFPRPGLELEQRELLKVLDRLADRESGTPEPVEAPLPRSRSRLGTLPRAVAALAVTVIATLTAIQWASERQPTLAHLQEGKPIGSLTTEPPIATPTIEGPAPAALEVEIDNGPGPAGEELFEPEPLGPESTSDPLVPTEGTPALGSALEAGPEPTGAKASEIEETTEGALGRGLEEIALRHGAPTTQCLGKDIRIEEGDSADIIFDDGTTVTLEIGVVKEERVHEVTLKIGHRMEFWSQVQKKDLPCWENGGRSYSVYLRESRDYRRFKALNHPDWALFEVCSSAGRCPEEAADPGADSRAS